MHKEYSNGEVTVMWKPELCIHAAVCVRLLPDVYKPKQAPWVTPQNATTEQLIDQIKQCPSGALSYRMNNSTADKVYFRGRS